MADTRRERLLPLMVGLAWFVALYALYAWWPGASRWLIETATVLPAAWMLDGLAPELQARAAGPRLLVDGGSMEVLQGCEGADLALLGLSAALASPMGWRRRLLGALLMLVAAFVLNQARLQLLLQSLLHAPDLFDPLHTLWLPLGTVLALAALFVVWLDRSRAR